MRTLSRVSTFEAPVNGTDLSAHVRADDRVETYHAAGDGLLEAAFDKAVGFWNAWSHDGQLHLLRGYHDAYVPAVLRDLAHNAAAAMQRRLGDFVWQQTSPETGLVPAPFPFEDPLNPGLSSANKQLVRFPLHAAELLAWFPSDPEYRTRAAALAQATRARFGCPDGGLHPWVDVVTGAPAGEVTYCAGLGQHLQGIAHVALLTGDTAAAAWLQQKLDFVWDARPSALPIVPDRYTRRGSVALDAASTDGLYLARSLFAVWSLLEDAPPFADLAASCRERALRITDQWNATGWMPQHGHYATRIRYGDGGPAEPEVRGDSKWNTLYANAWAHRATGAPGYLRQFKVAWINLKSRSTGPGGLIDATLTEGVGDGEAEPFQTPFLDALVDMYEASRDAFFLSEAVAHAERLLRAGHFPNVSPAESAQLLRLALAARTVHRLELDLPGPHRRVVVRREGAAVFDQTMPGEVGVVYLPAATYSVRVGFSERTVFLDADRTVRID